MLHSFARLFIVASAVAADDGMPSPFYRALSYQTPQESGNDVTILQAIINRAPSISSAPLEIDGVFGKASEEAVAAFQTSSVLPSTGVFDNITASALLECCERDGYVDDGQPASALGKLYKIIVPLPSVNRSVEAMATLLDKDNTVVRSFRVRTHGHRDDGSAAPWPDFGDGDDGLNELTSNGNTPTGLATVDLNSPEPADSEPEYGPYPVNRVLVGLKGNAALLLDDGNTSLRSGILMHTGEWPGWDASQPMPNSDGCLHGHPEDIEGLWEDLVALGVEVRPNPSSSKNYPYEPQGLISVFIDDGR